MSKDNLNSKLKALQLKSEKLLKDKEELDRKYESVNFYLIILYFLNFINKIR